MGLIQEAIKKITAGKEEKKHMEDVQRWQEHIQAKKMPADERDLLRYKEEERQARIKVEVNKYRQRDRDDMWRGKKFNPAYTPNMFKNTQNLFAGGKSPLLQTDHNLIKQKNMFVKK